MRLTVENLKFDSYGYQNSIWIHQTINGYQPNRLLLMTSKCQVDKKRLYIRKGLRGYGKFFSMMLNDLGL